MKINTNNWNRIRYTFYTPFYDGIVKLFDSSREKSISALNVQPGEKVLLVGAGTGLDLPHLPKNCKITATDLTPSMADRIIARNIQLNLNLEVKIMDGQKLLFPDNSFDKVILHMILAVIPDPVTCLLEVERVLKPGGKIAVFDKFIPHQGKISLIRRILNPAFNLVASDINRNFESIAAHTNLRIISKTPANFRGIFSIFLVEKPVK